MFFATPGCAVFSRLPRVCLEQHDHRSARRWRSSSRPERFGLACLVPNASAPASVSPLLSLTVWRRRSRPARFTPARLGPHTTKTYIYILHIYTMARSSFEVVVWYTLGHCFQRFPISLFSKSAIVSTFCFCPPRFDLCPCRQGLVHRTPVIARPRCKHLLFGETVWKITRRYLDQYIAAVFRVLRT